MINAETPGQVLYGLIEYSGDWPFVKDEIKAKYEHAAEIIGEQAKANFIRENGLRYAFFKCDAEITEGTDCPNCAKENIGNGN